MVKPKYPSLTQIEKRLWRLEKPVQHMLPGFKPFIVPAGFLTDGASVPRMFWSVCPPMSNYTNAAVLHDYLYHKALNGNLRPCGYTREEADDLFLAAMEFLGVARWRRKIMYRAVRWFGPRWHG